MPVTTTESTPVLAHIGGGEPAPAARDQCQSNVLRSMKPQIALYLFFRIVDRARFKRLVRYLVEPPATVKPEDDARIRDFLLQPPETRQIWPEALAHEIGKAAKDFSWTLAFTWTGLQALEINQTTLASFPEDFRQGMAARAAKLGDTGDSGPEHWEEWFGNRQTHGVMSIMLQAAPPQPPDPPQGPFGRGLEAAIRMFPGLPLLRYLDGACAAYGIEVLHTDIGTRITRPGEVSGEYRIEHFGFRDGISEPFAAPHVTDPSSTPALPVPPPPGGGTPRPNRTWDPIALGELLLGHPDEDGVREHFPCNRLLRDDGTYMVFRKLEQDVIGFRRFVARHDTTAGPESRLAAQMVGRWPNGTSLVHSPDSARGQLPRDQINDFRYQDDDPDGKHCPLGAHVRRINPRDSNNRDEARRHRIWRRGIPYGGPFLDYSAGDDGHKRGMLFVALCSRINQQFEFLQTRWLNGGEFIGQAGLGRCPLSGANTGDVQDSFVVAGRPGPYTHLPRFVTTRGGEYFFMPAIPALKALASEGQSFPPDPIPPELAVIQTEHNPGIDETPKVIDPDRLTKLARAKLLPPTAPAAPPAAEAAPPTALPASVQMKGVAVVARHALVRKVLEKETAFPAADQDARIRRMTGGEPLMLGMPIEDAERKVRLHLWAAAVKNRKGPPPEAIVAQAMQAGLARHGPAGTLDLVRDVSMVVPLVVAQYYFGVKGPAAPSLSYTASLFNKSDYGKVPEDWLAVLPHVQSQDMPIVTLAAWAQTAFAEVFVNVANARDLSDLAQRTTKEFFDHLDDLVKNANPADASTLLGCMAAFDPADFGMDRERFRVIVRLLLAELTVASAGTLAEALPSVVNHLLDHPDHLATARRAIDEAATPAARDKVLDAVIREALRFDSASTILFRRCATTSELLPGHDPVEAGSIVALLLQAAMFDRDAFPNPDRFVIGGDDRKEENYLHFGHGPHHCKGANIATPILREMVRPILALKDLRRAAGPMGNVFDSLGRYRSLVVRFTP